MTSSHDETGFLSLPAWYILVHSQRSSPIRQDLWDCLQLFQSRLCSTRYDDLLELREENQHIATEEANDGLFPSLLWYMRKVVAQAQPSVDFLARVEREVPVVELGVGRKVGRAETVGFLKVNTFIRFGHIEHVD